MANRLTPAQIAARARSYGLDPDAVLRVASAEGLSGGIGDGGHAYGPFQLNNAGGVISGLYGGRVNDRSVQDWAWSPQGVDFALSRMSAVAKGLRGRRAVEALVTKFERPADPSGEIARALQGSGGAGAEPPSPPSAAAGQTVAPQMDRAGLVRALLGASSSGDYGGFFQALAKQRQQPVAAQPGPLPGMSSGPGGQVIGGQGEDPRFLAALAQLARLEHAPVQINSGYRSRAKQTQLWNNRASNPNPVAPPGRSLHEHGLAADGTVNGIPLGRLPAALLARLGLATVPGDPVHVQWAGR